MILLGVVCHVVIGLTSDPCNFLIGIVTMMVKMSMATRLPSVRNEAGEESYDAYQRTILEQLPTSLYTALQRFNIDGHTKTFATCPSCNFTHKPIYDRLSTAPRYPNHCTNTIVHADGSTMCDTILLEERNGSPCPIKPYVVVSFPDHLARILADPEIERLCNQACDEACRSALGNAQVDMSNVFQGEFMNSFEGPVAGQLFIDRGGKCRLAFAIWHTETWKSRFNPYHLTR